MAARTAFVLGGGGLLGSGEVGMLGALLEGGIRPDLVVGTSVGAIKGAAVAADPYPRFRTKLVADGIATEDELAAIEAGVEADLDEAVEFALASPFPDLSEGNTDVYGAAA